LSKSASLVEQLAQGFGLPCRQMLQIFYNQQAVDRQWF
jgi:hypothetical protein